MLNRIEWDKPKVQADVFSLESLIAWLEGMPADETYNFMDCEGRCLFGQYVIAHGITWEDVKGAKVYEYGQDAWDFKNFLYHKIANREPWTFGAALARAQAS